MMNLFEEKLSLKFGLTLVLSVTMIISMFTGFFILKNALSIENRLDKRLEKTLDIAAVGLSSALWQFNNQYIQDFTKSLFLSGDIAYVKVFGSSSKTIIEKFRDKYKDKDFQYFKSSQDFLVKETDIFYENFNVGTVQLAISKEAVKESLRQTTKNTVTLILLVIVAILVTTFYMIREYLFKPVSRLEHLMCRVSSGDTDVLFDTGKKDEIGRLSRKIDRMISAMKKLTASRDELNHQINKRKKIENALRISEEKFREFVEGTDNLVNQLDKRGNYIYVNPVAANVLGLPQEELKGMRALSFIHKKDREYTKKWFNKVIASKKTKSYIENRITNIITGEVSHWLWTTNFLYENGEFSGANCIGHNITKIKNAEKERLKLESQLRQAHKLEAVGTLAGGIAHDFNNILGIILGNAELALHYVKANDEKAENKISEIITASLRAKDVVGQLLSFSRKNEIKKIPLKLDGLIKESAKLLRASIESSIEIKLDIDSRVKSIKAEPTQIHQIIINLCTNAAHAMEVKGGKIIISVENEKISPERGAYMGIRGGDYVKLKVTDTGHGIPEEIKEKIFDPYFTTKKTGKGSGMGLAVTHGIVKAHNGAINISSGIKNGTIVTIYFPAADFEPKNMDTDMEGVPEGSEHILFVDDEESLLLIAKEFLETLGYKVDACKNPIEALEHFKKDPELYDLVITDMTMPEMYGDQLLMEILKIKKDLPVILCTGFSDKIDEVKAKKSGISAYLEKPVDNIFFAKVIRNILNSYQNKTV